MQKIRTGWLTIIIMMIFSISYSCTQNGRKPNNKSSVFKVIAFYSDPDKSETAHSSFVTEAHNWFTQMVLKNNFLYDSTYDWNNLNDKFLSEYQVVIFLDSRPDSANQRAAFKKYVENGGGWMGFHFAGFALTQSAFPQNWDWYHNQFLGSGEYKGNTWRPTSAVLKVEEKNHPATKNLPSVFVSSPNEWYSWKNDLRKNTDIKILLSIDSTSFPLGTGPKLHEIWHSGDYPVVWTNTRFRMLYINMGHNDIDYEGKTDKELSFTFKNEDQNKLVLDGLMWMGGASASPSIK